MRNKYEIRGDVTAIYIKRRDGQVLETLIDTVDLEKVQKASSWCVKWDRHTQSFYVCSPITKQDGKKTSVILHRLIMNEPKGMMVDHINHNTLDNTRKNLRVVTHQQNMQNVKGARTDSKSGIRGVMYEKEMKKWRVRLLVNGKNMHFGYFDDLAEAEKVSIEARKKYFPYSTD